MPEQDVFDQAAAQSWEQAATGGQTQNPTPTSTEDSWDLAARYADHPSTPDQSGEDKNPATGSTIIVPKDGESFADTMKRAAAHGKTVSDAEVQKSARQGVKDTPTVMTSALAGGLGGTAALAAPGEIAAATPGAVKAIQAMVKAHPVAAALVKRGLQAVGAGEAIKHRQWLLDLLP